MPTAFRKLCDLCEKIEATSKRLVKTDLTASFLGDLQPDEVEPAVSMILGRPFPKWDQRTLEISWSTLSDLIMKLTQTDWSEFRKAFSETGDVGSAAKAVFEAGKIRRQTMLLEKPLSIMEVRRTFEKIAELSGLGSRERKERLIETLLGQASPLEIKYLIKILVGDMRTGFHEGLMEMAVAKAFEISLDAVQTASMVTGDIGEIASTAKVKGAEGISQIGFKVFHPIKPMMAQMSLNVKEALSESSGPLGFEYKLDGARIQIHKFGDEVRIYSRRLTDVTESLPEIVQIVSSEIKVKEVIVEGEVIALDRSRRNPLPFQHLMRRFRRVHGIDEMTVNIPVELQLFDVIYADGQNLASMSYTERRKRLSEIAGSIKLTKQLVTGDAVEAEEFLKEAVRNGHEGLMAKKLDSPYTPGVRGKRWFKIKLILEPLDLVIVAAEWGYGRRHEWLSDYYLAARDTETGKYEVLGKTFKGLTDREMIEMTKRLKELIVKEEPHRVIVIPKIVVEVAYNEIQKSPKYDCGMALRFARITRIRDDKTPEDADTIERVTEIYEKQYEKKAKFAPSEMN